MKFLGPNLNEVALSTLGFLKKIKGDQVNLQTMKRSDTMAISHKTWTALLQKHVADDGNVNYKGFITDKQILTVYLNGLSDAAPGNHWTEAEQLAYWINVYNAFTIKLIIDNYPLESIKDISKGLPMINSPWDIKFFKIGGIPIDLNTVEHEILRKQFNEPRIHFAINCASISCPKLRNEAFEADILETQLEDQTRGFIHNPNKNKISASETSLSKIFSWFESDFKVVGGFQNLLKLHQKDYNPKNSIRYLDYDWNLNE